MGASAYKECECGCGEPTKIADRTDRKRGWVKGQPRPYAPGHEKYPRAKTEEKKN